MTKIQATKNKAEDTVIMETKSPPPPPRTQAPPEDYLGKQSSDDLAGILNVQYQDILRLNNEIMVRKNNIDAINGEFERRRKEAAQRAVDLKAATELAAQQAGAQNAEPKA
jgi:hypothetical protein